MFKIAIIIVVNYYIHINIRNSEYYILRDSCSYVHEWVISSLRSNVPTDLSYHYLSLLGRTRMS
jgi:hypothetical protein